MFDQILLRPSFRRHCLHFGTAIALFLSTVSIVACDQQEKSDATSLRSDQVEILD